MKDKRKHRKIVATYDPNWGMVRSPFAIRMKELRERYSQKESINGTQEGAGTLLVEQVGDGTGGGDGGSGRPVGEQEEPHEEAAPQHDVEAQHEEVDAPRRRVRKSKGKA